MSTVNELKKVIKKVKEDIDRFYDAKKKFIEATHAYNMNIMEYNTQRDKYMEEMLSKSTGGKKGGSKDDFEDDDKKGETADVQRQMRGVEEERKNTLMMADTGSSIRRDSKPFKFTSTYPTNKKVWGYDSDDDDDQAGGSSDDDDDEESSADFEESESEEDDDEQLGGGNMNEMIKNYYYKHIARKN